MADGGTDRRTADHLTAATGNRMDTGATGFLGPGQAPGAGPRLKPRGRTVRAGAAQPQQLVRDVQFDCVAVPVEPESEPSDLPDAQRIAGRVLWASAERLGRHNARH
ncbi:hypothetical protein ACWCY6_12145 [Streptomyces sp. 900105755]